ncbi:MAG TPA: cytochrome c3 family protein, partial [Anaeromyxobacter sp.]
MAPLHLGALVALALAAPPGAEPDLVAMTFPPLSTLREMLPAALPPPPDRVYLETRSYGTVMVDHRAHLARRVACRACHGAGPVSRIELTPRSAHESCRACHVTASRGPTSCRDCHVQPAEPPVGQPGERVRFVFRGPGGTRLSAATSSRKPKPPEKVAAVAKAPAGSPDAAAAPSGAGAAPASAAPA